MLKVVYVSSDTKIAYLFGLLALLPFPNSFSVFSPWLSKNLHKFEYLWVSPSLLL